MATKAKAKETEKEAAEKETPDTPEGAPLLDLTDAAVRKMIKLAKKRGYVTYEQLNAVLPSEEVSSDKIEDIYAMLNEMGINTVETEEAETDEEEKGEEADDEESEGELVEATPKPLVTVEKKEPSERTDDPVRMYLREMGSVELLSREGEIAIAKRIEAGREAMIAGLCESPLTFQAIIIWRDELNEGKVFLRDIIDLEATYAGPGRQEPDGGECPRRARSRSPARRAAGATPFVQAPATQAAPPAAPAYKPVSGAPEGDVPAEGDMDDDEFENSMSLAAIEAELKPKVLETFDTIASEFKRLRRLQDQDIEKRLSNEKLTPHQERKYKKLKEDIITEVKSLRLNQHRIDALVDQLYDINRKLVGFEGRLMRLSESYGVVARGLPEELPGLRTRSALAQPRFETVRQGLEEPRRQGQGQDQGAAPRDPGARRPHRARDRRVPQDRAYGAEGRARGAPGEEGNGRGQPAPRHLHRQEIHQPRPAIPRPDPGRQYRPDEGGR